MSANTQVCDDFSDGDLTNDPEWTGSADRFKVSTSTAIPSWHRPGLQLDAEGAGTAWISIPVGFDGNRNSVSAGQGKDFNWSFWLKQSYNSSASNFTRIYLVSSDEDLSGPQKGYYLQAGGADDSIRFFRQDSLETISLFTIVGLYAGASSNAFRFFVNRSAAGVWKFYADPSGDESLVYYGEVTDRVYEEISRFGIWTTFTSSNATKFYFDELCVWSAPPDTIAPCLLSATLFSSSQVLLEFSEPVGPSAGDTLNYFVEGEIKHPYEALRMLEPEKVQLFFGKDFIADSMYELTIFNIGDLFGNVSGPITTALAYHPPKAFRVVITELMADPFPPAGLPGYEYIELHNASLHPVDLTGCSLRVNSKQNTLPGLTIPAGGFLLLSEEQGVSDLSVFGPVISITSTGLTNEGARVVLSDKDGNTLACVDYNDNWYGNDIKKEGGWSLEMIDPEKPCVGEGNWTASNDPSGGTPGRQNSVYRETNPDYLIDRICCIDANTLELTFSILMDSISLKTARNFSLDHGIGSPSAVRAIGPEYRSVVLFFGSSMSQGIWYNLSVSNIKDCTGGPEEHSFVSDAGLPSDCEPFNVLISEVLFNPMGDGVDFVEIYNNSQKIVDLSGLWLASVKERFPAPPDTQRAYVSESCRYLFPGAYLALTPDPKVLSEQYFCPDDQSLLRVHPFPSFNNDEGGVLLTTTGGMVIDRMEYSEKMHFPLLNTVDGVSLERISFSRPAADAGNWLSAAAYSGYATPGYENTQHTDVEGIDDDAVTVWPGIFSPDGDGKDDVLAITCRFSQPGLAGSVMVFDLEGRLVRMIAGNTLFGIENELFWDGRTDGPVMAPPGFYVIRVETIDQAGRTYRYKKAAALIP